MELLNSANYIQIFEFWEKSSNNDSYFIGNMEYLFVCLQLLLKCLKIPDGAHRFTEQ